MDQLNRPDEPPGIPALIAVKREMALAGSPPEKLAALKRELSALAISIAHGIIDRQLVTDEIIEHADAIGLTDAIGETPIGYAIADALTAPLELPAANGYHRHAGERLAVCETADCALGEWDAGDDHDPVPPRAWLLGNIFCRRFLSSLVAAGGVGKTALRYTQLVSLAIGRSLTGEHVFQRCRVLIVTLEDDRNEMRRRINAVYKHHGISLDDVRGWLFLAAPGRAGGKLMTLDKSGRPVLSTLAQKLEKTIVDRRIDVVSLDPFVKAHGVDENSNSMIDDVVQILTELADKFDIAVDVPHHQNKGASDPGNANRGRGASAMKDAGRLIYTATPMSEDEATSFGVSEAERRRLIRVDSAKVNIAPPMHEAQWFRLVGVKLGNASEIYPSGDEVQTVEPWHPPDIWGGLSSLTLNEILTDIEAGLPEGNRYSDAPKATDRAAWQVVTRHSPRTGEGAARQIIRTWVSTGLLYREDYDNPATRKTVKGLRVNHEKRPT